MQKCLQNHGKARQGCCQGLEICSFIYAIIHALHHKRERAGKKEGHREHSDKIIHILKIRTKIGVQFFNRKFWNRGLPFVASQDSKTVPTLSNILCRSCQLQVLLLQKSGVSNDFLAESKVPLELWNSAYGHLITLKVPLNIARRMRTIPIVDKNFKGWLHPRWVGRAHPDDALRKT